MLLRDSQDCDTKIHPQTGRRFTRLPSEPMQKRREEYVNVMISDTCFEAPLNRTAILHSYGYLDWVNPLRKPTPTWAGYLSAHAIECRPAPLEQLCRKLRFLARFSQEQMQRLNGGILERGGFAHGKLENLFKGARIWQIWPGRRASSRRKAPHQFLSQIIGMYSEFRPQVEQGAILTNCERE
jgi:hypothetical protein